MKHAFITLLNMSISGGFLILIVMIFRAIFKKVPRSVVLVLWAVVALRLVIPFSFGSTLSFLPGGSILPENVSDSEDFQVKTGYESIDQLLNKETENLQKEQDPTPGTTVNPSRPGYSPEDLIHGIEVIEPGNDPATDPVIDPNEPVIHVDPITDTDPVDPKTDPVTDPKPGNTTPVITPSTDPKPAASASIFGETKTDLVYSILFYVWLAGTAGMTIYLVVSCILLYRRTRASKKIGDRVYVADHISTAFLFGVFKPRIYLPSGITEEEARFVILHEETHLRRGDHLTKLFGFLILILHWFNPLVWVAYFSFSKDLEFSCDERVIKDCSKEERVRYSETMLALASAEKFVFAHPVAFGEGNIKSRVKRVLRYKKPAMWLTIVAVILVLGLSACLFTHRTEAPTDPSSETESETINETEVPTDTEPSTEEPSTEEPEPVYEIADIPELKTLSELSTAVRPVIRYDYPKNSYAKTVQVDGYRLDAYIGATKDAYCFSATVSGEATGVILFLSKEDGALLKAVPNAVDDAWSLSSVSLWNGGLVAVQSRTEGSIVDRVWHRRLVILDDEGKAKKVLMSWDDTSEYYNVMINLDPIGNKIAFTENSVHKIAFTENSVLKLIDLKSGEIEVIHEGDPSVSHGYKVLGSSKRYPNGVLFTVTEVLDYEEPKNELGAVTGVRMTRQETLCYYQFADGKTYPLLQTTADYAFDMEKDLQTASGPLWDAAVGDLQKVILYSQVSGLFASIDLENGVLYTLDRKDDYYDSDFIYHYPRVFFRAQDGTIVVEGGREILVDDGYNTFSAYRVLNDDLYGEKYLYLNVADPDGQTAFYVDRSAGVAYLYDFSKSEPELTESEIENRKRLLRSLDFSTPGDPFTEEEKEWIREYFSLVLLRADISGNDRIDDSVKAKWQTVTKLPHEKYNTECLFGDVRLLYDDGETAAVEYYVAYSSSYGPKGSNANLLLLKKVGGQWTTAAHAVEIWPFLGPEVLEIGRAVREAAKKSHGAITEQEIEDGKRAAIEYIVNERIQDLSEEDKNAIRACLSAEYIPEIYDGVLETDLEFTMNGLLMIRPLPYFYVTVYADAENLPENVRNAIAPCMHEYEGRYEKAFFVWYDTAFHASDTGSYVTKPIVLHGETEAFWKVRNAIKYASDGELKYQVRTANGEMSGWKPLDFSKDRSASDGRTPVKVLLSNMQSSAQYSSYYGTKYLWIADQKETWTLKLQDYSAAIETDGHVYNYYVWANESANQQFFMELQTVWEAEME